MQDKQQVAGGPGLLYKVIDVVIATLCIPFYLITYPLVVLGTKYERSKAARHICGQRCPHCQCAIEPLERLKPKHYPFPRIRLSSGWRLVWDRVPCFSLDCPTCKRKIHFDRRYRYTAADWSDCVVRRNATANRTKINA